MPQLQEVYNLIASHRLRFGIERDLQDDIEAVLTAACLSFVRECRIGTDVIDFFVPTDTTTDSHVGLGIECKIDGGPSAVIGQLVRYAQSPDIHSLLLVTSRHTHCFNAGNICSKPFRVLWIAGGGL